MFSTKKITTRDGVVVKLAAFPAKKLYDSDYASIKRDADLAFIYYFQRPNPIRGYSFEDCLIYKFPKADVLLKDKPYAYLEVINSKLTRIATLDLRGFSQLTYLDLSKNDIEELPGDLFIYTPNLQHIAFAFNKINVIGENILDPLRNLKCFDLLENPGIHIFYYQPFAGIEYPTFAQLKEAIKRCKSTRDVWKMVDEQKKHIKDLMRTVVSQKKDIDELKKSQEKKVSEFKKEIEALKRVNIDQNVKIEGLKKSNADQDAKIIGINRICNEIKEGTARKLNFTIKANEEEFEIEKEALIANSPVLAKIINENEGADTLELKDISKDTTAVILDYIQKKIQPSDTANFMELYAVSGRLQMKELMDLCAQKLEEKITSENSFDIFNLGLKFKNMELARKALGGIKKPYLDD